MTTRAKLTVIFHADVVGSTALVQRDERIAHERIQETFKRLSGTISDYGGVAHEQRGDALVAEFERASDAVSAALAFQASNKQRKKGIDDDIHPQVRIGIAIGEVVVADQTVTGAGVVLAQRLEQLAKSDGLCISSAIREALPARLPFDYAPLGEQKLKGFDEPIHVFSVALGQQASIPAPEPIVARRPWKRTRLLIPVIGLAVLFLLGIGYGLWLQLGQSDDEPVSSESTATEFPDRPSVAVLPFDNIGGDPDQEYFADGFSEDIITGLSSFHDLFVIARNSSFKFKGQNIDVRKVAKDLGVRYVLEGSVRRANEKLLINAQLIDAAQGSHLWAKRYDVDVKELFVTQDEMTQEIVSILVSKMRRSDHERVRRKREGDLTAYEHVLRARYLISGRVSKADTFKARELLAKAIEVDSRYAPAYAVLSYTYYRAFVVQWEPPEALSSAFEAAKKAIELDNWLAEGYDMLARVYSRQKQHVDSIAALEKAVSLNPNRAETFASLANTLTFAGQADEAVTAVRKAIRLDPFHSAQFDMYLGRALYFAKRYDKALLSLKTCIARAPGYRPCYMFLAPLYAELDRTEDAEETVATLLKLAPAFTIKTSVQDHLPFVPEAMDRFVRGLRKAGVPER